MENQGFTTLDSLIAEVSSKHFIMDNPHLIDEAAWKRLLVLELSTFGMNLMEKHDTVVRIKNGVGELPENFARLALAVHCQPHSAEIAGDRQVLVQSRITRERISCFEELACDFCEPSCSTDLPQERIVENLYMDANNHATFYYHRPVYVKLARDVRRDACTDDCINHRVLDAPYSISIKGRTVYANGFKEGHLYVEYYGVPMDENGDYVIPHTSQRYLEQYLQYRLLQRILEDAILSDDAPNKITMLQYYQREAENYHDKAKIDTSPMKLKSFWNLVGRRRQERLKFTPNMGNYKTNYIQHRLFSGYTNTLAHNSY